MQQRRDRIDDAVANRLAQFVFRKQPTLQRSAADQHALIAHFAQIVLIVARQRAALDQPCQKIRRLGRARVDDEPVSKENGVPSSGVENFQHAAPAAEVDDLDDVGEAEIFEAAEEAHDLPPARLSVVCCPLSVGKHTRTTGNGERATLAFTTPNCTVSKCRPKCR